MPPVSHALLSASSASRWLTCTASPRYEEGFPAKPSPYAEEGTVAHAVCEIYARKKFQPSRSAGDEELETLKADPRFDPEMLKTAESYVGTLMEIFLSYPSQPYVALESQVDLSEWVPEGFGTCDCCIIGDGDLHIVDYKHGVGVPVSSTGNAQMRLYALGAYAKYRDIFDIRRVFTTIVQPRIREEPDTEMLYVEDLLAWGETVKPVAVKAFSGDGAEFVPGESQCRFCRGKNRCRARAERLKELEAAKKKALWKPLTNDEIGDLLTRGADAVKFYDDLKEEASAELMSGRDIPGWKMVAGRSDRKFVDADKALETLLTAGYDKAILYDYKPKTLAQLEKVVGKTDFAKLMEGQIVKGDGKPTLVIASDKREAIGAPRGADEFKGIV